MGWLGKEDAIEVIDRLWALDYLEFDAVEWSQFNNEALEYVLQRDLVPFAMSRQTEAWIKWLLEKRTDST